MATSPRRPLGAFLEAKLGTKNNGRTIVTVADTTVLRRLDAGNPNDRTILQIRQRLVGLPRLTEYLDNLEIF